MKALIPQFLNEYKNVDDFDMNKAVKLIKDAYKPDENTYQKELEKRWYETYDYSVYDDKYYFTDVFYCWWKYSRQYIDRIHRSPLYQELTENVHSVLDVGNGIGYSTRQLKTIFPSCDVYGLNMKDTNQYLFNQMYGLVHNYKMIYDVNQVQQIDLIFASEFLEHIDTPIDYLNKLMNLRPKYIILANSFNTISVGHFNTYFVDGLPVDQSKISRMCNNHIRKTYTKLNTGFWNNKPNVWKLNPPVSASIPAE